MYSCSFFRNGTLEPAGNSLSEAGPKKELGERKEKGKGKV
jgi:hypothetical protein